MKIAYIRFYIALSISAVFILATNSVLAANCKPTPHRTTGTHYKPVTQQKINIGKGLTVSGQIMSSVDCKPLTGAKIAHWQAGKKGEYQDSLRAYLFSDQQGSYKFQTEWPALSTPHIHFIVNVKGYKKVETQWIGSRPVNEIKFNIYLAPNK